MSQVKREHRLMEVRAIQENENEDMIVEGYALTFNDPTVLYEYDGVKYYEQISANALDNADLSDVPFKYNHSDNRLVLARTRNKTLSLTIDEKGLFIRANIAPTQEGKDLYTLIKRGDIDKMSFAFTIDHENEGETYDRGTRMRTITRIKKLWDVAAVETPAYDTTSISARSFFELEREKEQKVLENAELRKKLKLKLKLNH